ncbi:uncharacterized protein LOC132611967 [Lycium barbarum]|uniref:uncharacterized protein LOC132611967 n=1 Tax=Lycium barbarum TaxID=112863 RepID=UPI00293EB8A5|nr:uncharacterized protein LOC132611967 [Lycium barbarum]
MEIFQHVSKIQHYKRRIGMPYANSNCNGKTWFFVNENVDVEILQDTTQQITNWFGHLEVEHLSRTSSDHAPMLLSCNDQTQHFVRPFKFLKFWTEHEDYKEKMKQVQKTLSTWSKQSFGDIFQQLSIREDIVKVKSSFLKNRMILQRAQAELKRHLHYEEESWRQKAGFDHFAEGDRNTRFFHSLVKGRRKRTLLKKIKNADGSWLKNVDDIAIEAADSPLFNHIPLLVSQEENEMLTAVLNLEEVKKAVFELSVDSASGPYSLNGVFYHSCWEIVGADVYGVLKDFWDGHTLPKPITHTNLVLL